MDQENLLNIMVKLPKEFGEMANCFHFFDYMILIYISHNFGYEYLARLSGVGAGNKLGVNRVLNYIINYLRFLHISFDLHLSL